MSSANTLSTALTRLSKALSTLDNAVGVHLESGKAVDDIEAEVQRMQMDRDELAQSLDRAAAKSNQMEITNKDVSRRLVAAMETIRTVIDGPANSK